MANRDKGISFDLDVDESEVKKPEPSRPIREKPPKPRVHNVAKINKEEQKEKDKPQEQTQERIQSPQVEQPVPSIEIHSNESSDIKVPNIEHVVAHVTQPTKIHHDNSSSFQIDPIVVTVIGTAAAVVAGAAAVTTGVAAPAITAVKAAAVKVKMSLGMSSKATAVVGGAALAGAAVIALEKKFANYEKDMQSTKEEVNNVGEQLKKMDEMLSNIIPKS